MFIDLVSTFRVDHCGPIPHILWAKSPSSPPRLTSNLVRDGKFSCEQLLVGFSTSAFFLMEFRPATSQFWLWNITFPTSATHSSYQCNSMYFIAPMPLLELERPIIKAPRAPRKAPVETPATSSATFGTVFRNSMVSIVWEGFKLGYVMLYPKQYGWIMLVMGFKRMKFMIIFMTFEYMRVSKWPSVMLNSPSVDLTPFNTI